MKWKKVKLGEVANYRKEKISINNITQLNYISTENMLPNKSGITIATNLPKSKTVDKYYPNDILISNIRPYFKKIWLADKIGGNSSDVMVIQTNHQKFIDKIYLYYTLSSDIFFDYVMASSKGTKMPRGDKNAILNFEIPLPPLPVQKKIAKILSSFDDKIELNNRMNQTLEEIAQTLFKHWFIDFEFPDENGNPYKTSGGEMKPSPLGPIPKTWEIGKLGEIINLLDSKRIPLSKKEREKREKIYPYYGAASLMDYVDDYLFEGVHILLGEDGTVADESGYPILQYVWGKFWVNNHAHVLKGIKNISEEFIYILLKKTSIKSIITGAVQPKINQENLKNLKVILPENEDLIIKYSQIIKDIFNRYRILSEENLILTQLRDKLLPKLMSGEIDVETTEKEIQEKMGND